MCSVEIFTEPIGIKGSQQSPCYAPPRMSVRSDTQFLDSCRRAVNRVLGDPQFFGSLFAASVKLLTQRPDVISMKFENLPNDVVRSAS